MAAAADDGASRRRRRFDLARPADRALVVALGVAALLALAIWSPNIGGREPGDPAAVGADPRLARCGGTMADVEYAFTIPHAREYQRYLPAMQPFSELAIDPPALVVIYRDGLPGLPPASTSGDSSASTASPGTTRDLCIYVGVAGQGELNYYRGISIAGLRATPDGPVLVPAPQT